MIHHKLFLTLCILLMLGLVSAWNSNTFNNSLSIENLTFTGNHNITRYLQVPQNALIMTGYLNLSGFRTNTKVELNPAYPYYDSWWYDNYTAGEDFTIEIDDGNLGYSEILSYGVAGTFSAKIAYIYENFTQPTEYNYTNFTFRYRLVADNNCESKFYLYCWSYDSLTYVNIFTETANLANPGLIELRTDDVPEECYKESPLQTLITLRTQDSHNDATCTTGNTMMSALYYGYPVGYDYITLNNTNMYIGNTKVWEYPGKFNITENQTNSLTNTLNSYLSSCSYISSYCFVPFKFHSDTAGLFQYSYLRFNDEGYILNGVTYMPIVNELSTQTFTLNLTYSPYYFPIATAILYYNGTAYPGTSSISGYDTIFTASINLPAINSQTNNSLYWTFALTNVTETTYYNSSSYNQIVNLISLGTCDVSSTLNTTAINFTAYDEQTLLRVNPFSIKGTLIYYVNFSANSKNYSFTNLNIAEKTICISGNLNFRISGLIQYSADGFTTTDYNFINHQVNNITQNISLYLLNVSSTTPFILKVQSQNQLPLENYYVYVYKYDAGDPLPYLVQVTKTDASGQTLGFFETYTTDYKFMIADSNGVIVHTTNKQKIIPVTTPYTITFTVGSLIPSPFVYFNNLTGITWNLAYNKATYTASLSYSDSNSLFQSALFTVKAMNVSGVNNIICNVTSNNSAGVLICNMSGQLSGTYFTEFDVNRGNGYIYVDRLSFDIEGMSAVVGMLGVLGAFFILLTFSFAFAFNEVAGIISLAVGFTICNVIGLLSFGIIGISACWGAVILVLVVLEWG